MKFKEIMNRLTGISTPICGISWEPPKLQINVARKIITFLEDRRVLYNPTEMEDPRHCVSSVLQIREFLIAELGGLDENGDLAKSVRAMRAACRKFLNMIQCSDRDILLGARRGYAWQSWVFFSALGELRGVFGVHIAQIAAQYGLDVEDALASILPLSGEEDILK